MTKLSWEKQNKNECKFFYQKISLYYKELNIPDRIILTRDYTDFLLKNDLKRYMPNSHLHHIIPRSCGGTDDKRNLIYLSLASHSDAHAILYVANRKNISIRTAATMLRRWQKVREKCLTVGEHRKYAASSSKNTAFYGESSYSWNSD